jgi:hypothetical protein
VRDGVQSYDYAHRQGIRYLSWDDFVTLVTDELVIFPWDQKVLIDGQWQPHPEIQAAIQAQENARKTSPGNAPLQAGNISNEV